MLGVERFPVDVASLAKEYSAQRFPNDPVISVMGDNLPGFEGGLFRAPAGRKGWGIIYNSSISSVGRINFTLAHEFGHFLLHRLAYPDGIRCGQQDVVRDSECAQVEQQANVFAANLLMPLDDFRCQIQPKAKADFDMITHCAERYKVSLTAAALRWISFTERRAVLVVSRDGFILWSKPSASALKTRAFFRASQGPVEIPAASLPMRPELLVDGRGEIDHDEGVWFNEPLREMAIFAEQYDFAISLLLLEDAPPFKPWDVEPEEDTLDGIAPPSTRRKW